MGMDKKTGIVKREIEDRRDPMAMAGWGWGGRGGGASFPKTRQRVSSVCLRGWVGGRLPWRFGPCLLLNTFFLLVFAHFCPRLSLELVVALRFSRLTAVKGSF